MVSARSRGVVPRGSGGAARAPAPAPSTPAPSTPAPTSTPARISITEPSLPAWAGVAAIATLAAAVAVLPGAPAATAAAAALEAGALARRRAAKWGAGAAWRAAAAATAPVLAADALLALCLFAFFKAAEAYGRARHARGAVPPYRGPWLSGRGPSAAPVPPRGFAPGYLLIALTAAFLLPAGALLVHAAGAGARGAPHPAAAAALVPYLGLFLFQYACEMVFLRRSFMAPAIPLAFLLVRPWQLARGLSLARGGGLGLGTWPPAPAWCAGLLSFEAVFWTFDTAALLCWLPWTYNWHLQAAGVGRG